MEEGREGAGEGGRRLRRGQKGGEGVKLSHRTTRVSRCERRGDSRDIIRCALHVQ